MYVERVKESFKKQSLDPSKPTYYDAMLFAFGELMNALILQKNMQRQYLEDVQETIKTQMAKNDELNKLDYVVPLNYDDFALDRWNKFTQEQKDGFALAYWNNTHPGEWKTSITEAERPALYAQAFSMFKENGKDELQKEWEHSNNGLGIQNSQITKERDYITNQITLEQQKQQVLLSQSQAINSCTAQSLSVAESTMGSIKSASEKVCYVVG